MEKLNQKYQPAVKKVYGVLMKYNLKPDCCIKCSKIGKITDKRSRRVTNRFCTHRSTFGNCNIDTDNNHLGHSRIIDIII